MWKTVFAALTVLTLFQNVPVPAASRDSQGIAPGGCVVQTIEIEGKLGYQGNRFGWLPNGRGMWMTEMYFPWEGYYIDAGGKRYILDLPIGDKTAERLKGKTVRASGLLGQRQVGHLGKTFSMPLLRNVRLKLVEEALEERSYEGSAKYWNTADEGYALKSKDRRTRVEHVRALLGEDLKSGKHTVRVERDRLVVRTTAANHARIKAFLDRMKVIPGPAR
jgi:hypothetical protein